ncbi:hypothetical protein KSP40_PGU010268 [Platanthera guangdongensis]|uniref:Uncharacterized protein n=1 Tax=Platanthera guangdongensis TaxID=2320717 RepID=A0ABR2LWQ5_9ASPA
MTKKRIRFSVDPDPPSSFLAGEEAMARFKHQNLFQDYQELLKETKDKKERLHKEMQKKHKLLAEVKFTMNGFFCRFLRKKYQSLTKSKKQSHRILSPSKQVIRTPPDLLPLKERNFKSSEASVPTRKLIDLNQVSLPNDEETDPFGAEREDLKMEKLRRFEASSMADDLKLSVCREIGSSSNRLGKRRVSWQDQLALRV